MYADEGNRVIAMREMNERAQSNAETMEELQARIGMLEHENHLLRERLEKAGISYEDLVFAKGVNAFGLL